MCYSDNAARLDQSQPEGNYVLPLALLKQSAWLHLGCRLQGVKDGGHPAKKKHYQRVPATRALEYIVEYLRLGTDKINLVEEDFRAHGLDRWLFVGTRGFLSRGTTVDIGLDRSRAGRSLGSIASHHVVRLF